MRLTWCPLGRLAMMIGVLVASGCASSHGFRTLSAGDSPTIVMRFRPDGLAPLGAAYVLVTINDRLAMLEQPIDGPAVLYTIHWQTGEDHHFAAWHKSGHAVEFIVPDDLTFPAYRYVYPNGAYRIEAIDEQERPVPLEEESPVTMLVPIEE